MLRPPAAAALALAVLLAAAPSSAAPGGDTSAPTPPTNWPWGGPDGEGASSFGRKDWYNLGLLGAKASDPARAVAADPSAEGGVHTTKMEADPSADRGPDRLRVEALFPDGPAAKAGLKIGDVIAGVNGRPFEKGSIAPLAKAILDAESGATKGVALLVERATSAGGARAMTPTLVAVPVFGKEAKTPTVGKARVAQVDAALAWLAKRQEDDGGFPTTLCGTTGQVVQAAMAGLAWVAGGSDLAKGRYSDNVKKALAFVKANVGADAEPPRGGGPNTDQTNWGFVHAALFLGELQARSPDAEVSAELKRIAEQLVKRQETSGGWAHGPGGPNGLGYVELNIMAGLSLLGIGLARETGWAPPDNVIEKARQYVEDSSGGDGGVGYSTKSGQKGQGNIGRSAVMWMAYDALGFDHDKWTSKMAGYVKQHAGDVFGGHASLMEHFCFAGVASQALGGDAAKGYWAAAEANLVLARAPDGSFQPRPWHESLQMGSNSDVTFGDVWTTAAWTLVLASDGAKDGLPGLPAMTGKIPSKPRPK